MQSNKAGQVYELEERSFKFARDCRDFVKKIPKSISNFEYGKQLIRSSASQAANYIEANESLGKKDFVHKLRICRKETKESCLWLRLIEMNNDEVYELKRIVQEAIELRKIFNAIIEKSIK